MSHTQDWKLVRQRGSAPTNTAIVDASFLLHGSSQLRRSLADYKSWVSILTLTRTVCDRTVMA